MKKKKMKANDIRFFGELLPIITKRVFDIATSIDGGEIVDEFLVEDLTDILLVVKILSLYTTGGMAEIDSKSADILSRSKKELEDYLSDILNGNENFTVLPETENTETENTEIEK